MIWIGSVPETQPTVHLWLFSNSHRMEKSLRLKDRIEVELRNLFEEWDGSGASGRGRGCGGDGGVVVDMCNEQGGRYV